MAPTFPLIIAKLQEVIAGSNSREALTQWATTWINEDYQTEVDSTNLSAGIIEALDLVAGADAPGSDRPYLYDSEDFSRWLLHIKTLAATEQNAHKK